MRYLLIIVMFFGLIGCGQGNEGDKKTGYPGAQSEYEVKIPVRSEDEAVRVVRDFAASELNELAYSGLYLLHDPSTHVVMLIQEDYFNEEVANQLVAFAEKNGSASGSEFMITLKPAQFSYKTLETITNELLNSLDDLLTNRKVFSMGIDEMENRIDLFVSTKADLNLDLLNEIIEGNEAILNITEGLMSSVDDNGVPTADPYIVGKIMSIEGSSLLIEDQIYFSVDEATLILDSQGKTIEMKDLNVGDTVAAWTDGHILESFPAQGYALVIQVQ
ncbi:MAG: hypothetical protein ACK4M9_06035 [Anaerobacillus sp.]|uniref:hypothetical protein n=1 Tax=Anaerobacillus sp. TaxID=1872506 RepID=UPI00391B8254